MPGGRSLRLRAARTQPLGGCVTAAGRRKGGRYGIMALTAAVVTTFLESLMDLDSYLLRGSELAATLDLNDLTDAGMEKLEDLALDMAHGAWNPILNPELGATADKLWHDVFEKNCYDLSIQVDIPEDGYWKPFDPDPEGDNETHADPLFADFADEDDMAEADGGEPIERPDYTALKVLLIASDTRPAHAGDSFILAKIYVRVELPLSQFEHQAPGSATIFFFPEMQDESDVSSGLTISPAKNSLQAEASDKQ